MLNTLDFGYISFRKTLNQYKLTDQEVIDAIIAGEASCTEALDFVNDQYHAKITGYLKAKVMDSHANNAEWDANDLFVDAIVALRSNVLAGRLTELNSASMETYLTTIARFTHFAKVRKARRGKERKQSLPPLVPDDEAVDEELPLILRRFVRELGQACREMITFSYFDELPMKEVIQLTTKSYKSAATGNVENQRCRQKLKAKLTAHLKTIN